MKSPKPVTRAPNMPPSVKIIPTMNKATLWSSYTWLNLTTWYNAINKRVNRQYPSPKLMKVVNCIIDCWRVPINAPITKSHSVDLMSYNLEIRRKREWELLFNSFCSNLRLYFLIGSLQKGIQACNRLSLIHLQSTNINSKGLTGVKLNWFEMWTHFWSCKKNEQ
jgi:hypothetical protein